jgi:hypothetical protein
MLLKEAFICIRCLWKQRTDRETKHWFIHPYYSMHMYFYTTQQNIFKC